MNRIAAVILCVFLLSAPAARAKTSLDVDVGWEGIVRMGRWTPVQVTVADPGLPNAVIEIAAAHDSIFTMRVHEAVGTLTAQPKTFVLYVPMNGYIGGGIGSALSVVVRDADSGKVLAFTKEDDPRAFNAVQEVQAQGQLVGITGRRSGLNLLRTAVNNRLSVGFLPIESLPINPAGLDALDLLVLNEPDITAMSVEQQQALVDWIRAGGNLLFWPGTDPLPQDGPLVDALPCHIGGATVVEFTPDRVKALGLPPRFAKIPAHELEPNAKSSTEAVKLLNGDVTAYRTDLGLGRIVVSPIDLADLAPVDDRRTYGIWSPALDGMLDRKLLEASNSTNMYGGYSPSDTRQAAAESVVTDLLGDVPGAGQFGFSYIAVALIGLMVIVGPVDWLVLRALKRQAWTWVTTSGWIGLVTFAALYTGHAFKSGDLHYRTYGLIDQAGDGVVARTEFVGLYSPQTSEYTLQTPPNGWWEPLAPSQYYYAQRTGAEIGFDQTYHGNTPRPMQVSVWSLRFQKGQEYVAEPKVIDAELTMTGGAAPKVVGTIKNLTDRPLRNVRVVIHGRATPVVDTVVVQPHSEAKLDQELTIVRNTDPNVAVNASVDDNQGTASTEARRIVGAAEGLSADRARQFDRRLESGRYAIVLAEQDAPDSVVTLTENAGAIQQHVRVIRALIPLKSE